MITKNVETIEQKCLAKGVKLLLRVLPKFYLSKEVYGESDHLMLMSYIVEFQKLIAK